MLKRFLLVILLVTTPLVWAVDLPKLSYINEKKVLKTFPLEKATKKDVYSKYGPPNQSITGLPFNGESWTYSKGPESKTFTFVFRGDKVYDVIVRYRAGIFKDKSARKIQKLDKD